jgi:fructose-bisphosphate aldolase class 1
MTWTAESTSVLRVRRPVRPADRPAGRLANGNAYAGDNEMLEVGHQMPPRIITSPAFNGEQILGAILFEETMDREIEGKPTAEYLWNVEGVVPFVTCDQGPEASSAPRSGR